MTSSGFNRSARLPGFNSGVQFETKTVGQDRSLGSMERHAVRPIVRAQHVVIGTARGSEGRAQRIHLAAFVAEQEIVVLKGHLHDVRILASVLDLEAAARGADGLGRLVVQRHDVTHAIESMRAEIRGDTARVIPIPPKANLPIAVVGHQGGGTEKEIPIESLRRSRT